MTDGNNKVKNYYKGRNFNPFRYFYIYIDAKSYMADDIFVNEGLTSIRFKSHFTSNTYTDFNVVFCTIRKKDKDKFIECMNKLQDKIAICGLSANYNKLCSGLITALETRKLPTDENEETNEE